jgi:hypothetical protein
VSARFTLEKLIESDNLRNLPEGNYILEYTDSTHLEPNKWIRLGAFAVEGTTIPVGENPIDQYYTFKADIGELPGKPTQAAEAKGGEKKDAEYDKRLRVVRDSLALALARAGLLCPDIPDELFDELLKLNERDGVVIVPDTNAMHNGAIHWMLRVLHRPAIWLLPVVTSLTTIQTRDATLKNLVNKKNITGIVQALRSRSLVNGALGLLERNKGRSQVVEIDPSLLRYQKMSSGSGSDPDQGDVLEDRLIIEGIQSVLRAMRSRTTRRVVTSDVNVARVLNAEGINTLFIPGIVVGSDPIPCLRYDALARAFIGAPLSAVLWELAHAFSSIRLLGERSEVARFDCYWAGKTPAEWATETLLCAFPEKQAEDGRGTPQVQITHGPTDKARATEEGEQGPNSEAFEAPSEQLTDGTPLPTQPRGADLTVRGASVGAEPRDLRPHLPARRSTEIATALPRASLPQMLRLLAAARRLGEGTAEEIAASPQAGGITPDNARRALEVLRRVHLIEQNGKAYRPTTDVELVGAALKRSDLDTISSLMERFRPYEVLLLYLRHHGSVKRGDVSGILRELIGAVGTYESERLPRFHILLGQAWTKGDLILDGSQRPTDRDASEAFEQAFRSVASVGIAKVVDLLPRFSELTRMSPWAAKRRIERFVADRLLPEYNFQPAAGAKPVTRDEILAGTLDRPETEPVIIDRFHLGERPVFTVERSFQ